MPRKEQGSVARRRGFCTRLAAGLLAAASAAGCSTVTLHDDSRAQLAASARKTYADANVADIASTEQQNLAVLLDEEIKVVRDNYALQADYAALEFASGTDPMGVRYLEAVDRLGELGFKSVESMRGVVKGEASRAAAERTMATVLKTFQGLHFNPPQCGEQLAARLELPADTPEARARLLNFVYQKYREACAAKVASNPPDTGLLAEAHKQWADAKAALDNRTAAQQDAARELADASKAYDARAKDLSAKGAKGEEVSKSLASEATRLAGALDKAKSLGAGGSAQIESLVELLTAVAGGTTDSATPSLARATLVAKQIPSLTQAAIDLETKRTAPPVSGLLLELHHQSLLADTAKKRADLAQERVDILKQVYDARLAEAQRLLDFTDAVCIYALASAGRQADEYGPLCDRLVYQKTPPACLLDRDPIEGCVLLASWKDRLAADQPGTVKRKLYVAVTSYLQALSQQELAPELAFRELDVQHRETLLAESSAIQAWNNLVSVPLDQLDGYYQGGLKPAEIADLWVKALGFTAITVGVSR
jgi:hypothetical protein